MMAEVDQPGIGRFLAPGSPLEFANSSARPARTAPVLGEHTADVLSEILGLSGPELEELGRQRVIGERRDSGGQPTPGVASGHGGQHLLGEVQDPG